jgi:hypothetical protein
MNDFETLPRGTIAEIQASRKLANAIAQLATQYGHGLIPDSIWKAYIELVEVYNRHMLNGDV